MKGIERTSATRRDEADERSALLVRGGDVEEAELVRPLGLVPAGGLDRVARVAQVLELQALDDTPPGDVEARDDADGEAHEVTSRRAARAAASWATVVAPEWRARPKIAPAGTSRERGGDRREVLRSAHPARGEDLAGEDGTDGGEQVEVRTGHRAVARDVGDEERAHTQRREAARDPGSVSRSGVLDPAVDRRAPLLAVEGDDEARGRGRGDERREERRLAEREAPEDDARGARRRERRLDGRPVAQAAADLDRNGRGRDDLGDRAGVAAGPERRVEVDDVDPVGPLRREAEGDLDGALRVDRPLRRVAVEKADDLPSHQVDGGPERDHAASERKFSRIRRPADDDFSGWNWQPQTLPRRAAATNRPPWSHHAATSAGSTPSGRNEWTK